MGNTNFQTIHQMGASISDFVKQATGRDNVQNIDMDHITVAQNHRYEEVDISGQVVSFQAGEAGRPFEKLDVQIKPVQDLHGYDSPWPAGGGKNLLPEADGTSLDVYGVTVTVATDGTITMNGTATQVGYIRVPLPTPLPIGDYAMSWFNNYAQETNRLEWSLRNADNYPAAGWNLANVANKTYSFTLTEPAYAWQIQIPNNSIYENYTFHPMLVAGSIAPTEWTPYSNICPITGWTMVNVYQAGQNMEDARVYRFTFPSEAGIVYGGTLDVVTGVLVVDWHIITRTGTERYGNYQNALTDIVTVPVGYAQSSKYIICSHGTYTDGIRFSNINRDSFQYPKALFGVTDATEFKALLASWYNAGTPLQICYKLATPITFHLSPQEITTLLGQNYIWADTGDIEVKFTNVKEMY